MPEPTIPSPNSPPAAPAIFLDRDGTLVRDFAHAADPAALVLLPGVAPALLALQAVGYRLVVVSNQSGVARGLFTAAEARASAARVVALLAARGIRLSGYYFCPHHPQAGHIPRFAIACGCRKPAPGLLLRAASELGIDLARSWLLGDSLGDLGAALAAGARPILVDTGGLGYPEPAAIPPALRDPRTRIAPNLPAAAAQILGSTATAAEIPWTHLVRPRPAVDRRKPGEASPWPDAEWLARAERDGRALEAGGAGVPAAGGAGVPAAGGSALGRPGDGAGLGPGRALA